MNNWNIIKIALSISLVLFTFFVNGQVSPDIKGNYRVYHFGELGYKPIANAITKAEDKYIKYYNKEPKRINMILYDNIYEKDIVDTSSVFCEHPCISMINPITQLKISNEKKKKVLSNYIDRNVPSDDLVIVDSISKKVLGFVPAGWELEIDSQMKTKITEGKELKEKQKKIYRKNRQKKILIGIKDIVNYKFEPYYYELGKYKTERINELSKVTEEDLKKCFLWLNIYFDYHKTVGNMTTKVLIHEWTINMFLVDIMDIKYDKYKVEERDIISFNKFFRLRWNIFSEKYHPMKTFYIYNSIFKIDYNTYLVPNNLYFKQTITLRQFFKEKYGLDFLKKYNKWYLENTGMPFSYFWKEVYKIKLNYLELENEYRKWLKE